MKLYYLGHNHLFAVEQMLFRPTKGSPFAGTPFD